MIRKKVRHSLSFPAYQERKKDTPLYRIFNTGRIELERLLVHGDAVFTYELYLIAKDESHISLKKELVLNTEGNVKNKIELDQIAFDAGKYQLYAKTDTFSGEAFIEIHLSHTVQEEDEEDPF